MKVAVIGLIARLSSKYASNSASRRCSTAVSPLAAATAAGAGGGVGTADDDLPGAAAQPCRHSAMTTPRTVARGNSASDMKPYLPADETVIIGPSTLDDRGHAHA